MSQSKRTFRQQVVAAQNRGFKEVIVRRSGWADYIFEGSLVAEVRWPGSVEGLNPLAVRDVWNYLALYVTRSEQFVCLKVNDSDLRRVRREADLCDDVKEVTRVLGASDVAKQFYATAGIDAFVRLEDEPTEDEDGPEAETSRAAAREEKPAEEIIPEPKASIYETEALEAQIKRSEEDPRAHTLTALRALRESGNERRLCQVPEDALERIARLGRRFPNLDHVVSYFLRQISLAGRGSYRVVRFPPLLMVGPAGVGKTRFVLELAKALGLDFIVIALNTMSASFILSGSDSRWSTGKPGRIFELLRDCRWANVLVLLDEIDKVHGGASTTGMYDPYGPLYGLLERRTAAAFQDEFTEVALDSSHICWIATAIDLNVVPEPIVSRFRTVSVNPPRPDQMAAIVASVWHDLLSEEGWGARFSLEIQSEAVAKLCTISPRDLRAVLTDAAGSCSLEYPTDYQGDLVILPEHIDITGKGRKPRRIGFLAED